MNLNKLFLFCTVFLVVFASCSDDDNDKVNNSIIGNWKFKEVAALDIKTNDVDNDKIIIKYLLEVGQEDHKGETFEFSANGNVVFTQLGEEIRRGSFSSEGGILTITWADGDTDVISIENGVLFYIDDYLEEVNNLELDELIKLKIKDPSEFEATKALVKSNFDRQ